MDTEMTESLPVLYNYPGKHARSIVWTHFGFVKLKDGPPSKENLDMKKAICRICRKVYAYNGNTTGMMFHMDHEHKELATPGVATKDNKPMTQLKISKWNKTTDCVRPLTNAKKLRIDEALTNFVVEKLVPFSMIEHPSFVNFVYQLDDRYEAPGRKLLVNRIHSLYDRVRSNLESELADLSDIAITHDAWTSINTESYDTVTVHYISSEWELKSAVLRTQQFEGSHTGENIAQNLKTTVSEWKLPKMPIAVTDNAANEKRAFTILGWTRTGCYGHRINLVVKNALKINEISRIIAKGRAVVTYFHQSPLAMGILFSKQKLLLESETWGHKLIQDVATRWNNTLAMLERLSEQLPALQATVLDGALGKKGQEMRAKLFTYEEQATVDDLITVLQPFKIATELLSADRHPTQHLIIPTILKLQKALEIADDDRPVLVKVKREMRQQLDQRTEDRDIALIACLLEPSTKQLRFLEDSDRETAKSLLYDEIRSYSGLDGNSSKTVYLPEIHVAGPSNSISQGVPLPTLPDVPLLVCESDKTISSNTTGSILDPVVSDEIVLPSTSKRAKMVEEESRGWLMDIIECESTQAPLSDDILATQELDRYLAEPAGIYLKSLDWWKRKGMYFPKLNRAAKKYLAIPASSVSAERIFSLAGNLVSKKRSQLKPENVDRLIFLNKNKDGYPKVN